MQTTTLRQGALDIAYRVHGTGGPTLVLLHGFCGDGRYWDPIVSDLSADFKLVIPDLRGHGASSVPSGPYRIEEMAEDIELWLQALDIQDVWMFGHSLGGYITLAYAEAYPERLRGWGLIHSTAYPDAEPAKENRLKGMNTIRDEGLKTFVDELIPKLFAPNHKESMADSIEAMKQIGYGTAPEGAIATLDAMRTRVDRRGIIERSSVPVALIAGSEDGLIPVEKVHAVQGPHIQSDTIQDCGHMGMIEAPTQMASLLRAHASRTRG